MNKIIISHSYMSEKRLQALLEKYKPQSTLALISDKLVFERYKRLVPEANGFLSISGRLNDIARRIKGAFNEVIGELGLKHASLSWWGSKISSRNTLVSPLFLRCCYLCLFKDVFSSGRAETILVICDDDGVMDAINNNFGEQAGIYPEYKRGRLIRCAAKAALFVIWNAIYVMRVAGIYAIHAAQKVIYRDTAPRATEKKMIIRTFISGARPIARRFEDAYFPGLREWLDEHGIRYMYYPVIGAGVQNYWRTLLSLRRCDADMFFLYDRLPVSFMIMPLINSFNRAAIRYDSLVIDDMRMEDIFNSLRFMETADDSELEYYAGYCVKNSWINVSGYLTIYENMPCDKLFIMGVRKYQPDVEITANYFTPMMENLLCGLPASEDEACIAPVPDRLLVYSERYAKEFVSAGFAADRVYIAPALKLFYLKDITCDEGHDENSILVFLPINDNDAGAMLYMLKEAFENTGMARKVYVKPHPSGRLNVAGLIRGLKAEIVSGSASSLMCSVSIVITQGSTTAIEAKCSGKRVLIAGSENSLIFDPSYGLDIELEKVYTWGDLAAALEGNNKPEAFHAPDSFCFDLSLMDRYVAREKVITEQEGCCATK